ncbi:MAG: Ig-like domain-containing protein [Bacteroidales bacterium]|nr:Ig-like domain-containing protein [Bacteroidales bacterium]
MKKYSIPATLLAVVIVMMAIFSSCREEHDFSYTPLPVSGAVIHNTHDTIAIGDVLALNGHTVPMNATNQAVTWRSSDNEIATVDSVGRVTGVALGTVTITLTTVQGSFTDTSLVTVIPVPIPVTGVTLNEDSVEITIGQAETLIPTIEPADATIQGVTWSSSDTAVARVSNAGVVTAVSVGTATITVTTNNGGFTATTEATVIPIAVTGVTLNMNTVRLEAGETQSLTATVSPVTATNRNINWGSSNPAVATVSSTGPFTAMITAVANGETTITVMTADGSLIAVCMVTVGDPPVGGVNVNNITDYEQDSSIKSLVAFLDGTSLVYEITLMSPTLNAWRTAYAEAFPDFSRITITLPFSALDIQGLGAPSTPPNSADVTNRSLSVNIHYTTTTNVWPFAPAAEVSPTLVAMTGAGNNENSDATFTPLLRRDRSPATLSGGRPGATPHSTSPPTTDGGNGYGFAQDSDEFRAISGIFTPIGFSTAPERNEAASGNNFIGFLNSSDGFTIIQDIHNPGTFWFRSKADPTDWFVVVRQ